MRFLGHAEREGARGRNWFAAASLRIIRTLMRARCFMMKRRHQRWPEAARKRARLCGRQTSASL